MTAARNTKPEADAALPTSGLFVVWIDCNCGIEEWGTEWEMNSAHLCPARPLQDALDEAAECRALEFPTKIMPEGVTPRPDGLFSKPHMDPMAGGQTR